MEMTEQRVREIVREEIVSAEHRNVLVKARKLTMAVPPDMLHTEASRLRDMGLDPFEEAEKPKPHWMSYIDAAEYRAAGVDPTTVDRVSYMGEWS